MNNSRLKRALSGFLSVAMLIMCMPLVGISAGALDSTTQVLLTAQGGHFGEDESNVSKNITLTSDNKLPAGTLDEEPTYDGKVFGYWSTYRELDEGGSTIDRVTEDYVFTDANINGGNIQINANWYNQCTEISVNDKVQMYNGYALPSTDEVMYKSFGISQNTDVKPTSAEWYYVAKDTAFDINTATKYTSGDADADANDYYLVITLDITHKATDGSETFYRCKDMPKVTSKNSEAPAAAIDFTKETVRFSWKVVPYEMITEITDVSINPDVTAFGYTLSAGDFPEEFTGTVKGTTKSGKSVTMSNLFRCLWYEAGKVGATNPPASTAEDGKTYVPAFLFVPPEKCYAASSEVMAGMENAKVSASLSAKGYGVDPVEGFVLITGPEITVGAGSSSDPLLDTPIAYLEDVTLEPAAGDTTGTTFVFKNIPQLTEQEVADGFEYIYSLEPTGERSPEVMAEEINGEIMKADTMPAGSTIDVNLCNDLPKDLKITVDANSVIFFAKVNRKNTNYLETSAEGSAYYTFAQKVIPVTPGAASDPLHDTPIVYLEDVTVEPADGDTTGTSFVFKNIPQLTAQETAAGFAYVYTIQSTKDILPPEDMAEDYNSPIRLGKKTPSESSLYADVCNDIPDDLKITVTEESMIIFAKVNKTDPNYRQTIDEDSAYFVLAAKAIPVTPTAASDPLLDTPIAYLKDVTVELADDDTTGTTFVFKNVPQLTEEEVAAGFEYIYSLMPAGSTSPDVIADQFNERIAEEDTKPAKSTIGASQCTALPKDLTITVNANSVIFFAKVNRKNSNYCETTSDDTKYYTFAQKVIPVSIQAQTEAEKAAKAIDKALDALNPTNDTVQADIQTIVDANKGDATATIKTFTLTPATKDNNGSLYMLITVSDSDGNTKTIERNYVIAKLPASTGGDIIVDTDGNVGGAGVDGAKVEKAVEITPEEKALINNGENLHIILNVLNADTTVSDEDKALIQSALTKGMTVRMFLDITLFKKIGTLQTAVTATKAPITITFEMPDSLINTNKGITRRYFIIRVHNGVVDILDCRFDPATGKASFATDKFSSYAIAYTDTARTNSNPSSGARPNNSKTDTTPSYKLNVTAQAQEDSVTLSWNEIKSADSYIVYQLVDGKYVEIKTTKDTSVTIGGLVNGTTYNYLVKYVANGKTCSIGEAGAAAVTASYYKLSVTAQAQDDSITLSWNKIENADGYIVYQLIDGKYVEVAATAETTVAFSGITSGTYSYMVKYTVGGKPCSESYAGKASAAAYGKLNVTAQTKGRSITLSWNEIENADSYIVYRLKGGKYVKVRTVKGTSVTFNKPKNDRTYDYMVKYVIDGKICSADDAGEASVYVYYKPAVTAKAGKNSVTLKWKEVPDADKYAIYKYTNGKAVKLAEITKHSPLIKVLKSDTEYQFLVSAYVDGKWTAMTKSDIVTIRTKA